jgi:hypothetical protein
MLTFIVKKPEADAALEAYGWCREQKQSEVYLRAPGCSYGGRGKLERVIRQ